MRGQHTLTRRQHSGGPRVGQNFTANYILPSWSQDGMTNAHLSLCQLWDKLQTESPLISHPPIRAVPARQLASDTPRTRRWLWDHQEDRDPGKKQQAADAPHPQWAGLAFLPLLDAVQLCGHLCTQPQAPPTWACLPLPPCAGSVLPSEALDGLAPHRMAMSPAKVPLLYA